MGTRREEAAAAVIAIGTICATAGASISYTSQERYISASAYAYPGTGPNSQDSDYAEATDFAVFDETVVAFATDSYGSVSADAKQYSALNQFSIITNGNASEESGPPVGSSGAVGQSVLRVTFELAAPSPYTLSASGTNNYVGEFSLIGPSVILDQPNVYAGGPVSFSVQSSGTLAAGTYELTIIPSAQGVDYIGHANYSFELTLPAPSTAALLGLGGLALIRRRR